MKNKILESIKKIKNNRIISDSKNYLFAELFNKGLIFFTIPIFTRILTPEEYGILGVYNSLVSLLIVLIGLNINSSIIVRYNDSKKYFNYYLGANLNLLIISIILLGTLLALNGRLLSNLFKINEDIFIYAILTAGMVCVGQFYQSYLQTIQHSKKYAILSMAKNIIFIILSTSLIYIIKTNKYYGVIYSSLFIGIIFSIICIYSINKVVILNFKYPYIKYGLLFSVPLIPHSLSGIIFSQIDRLMIDRYLGAYQVGLYYLSYNIGLLVPIFVAAINNAWAPFFFKKLQNYDYKTIQDYSEKYVKVTCLISFILILFSKQVVSVMANEKFIDSYKIIPIFAIAGVFNLLYALVSLYLFKNKKTVIISIITITCCITNILLNYALIPYYGINGAAYAALFTSIILFYLNYIAAYINNSNIIKMKAIYYNILLLIIFSFISILADFRNIYFNIIIKIVLFIGISLCYISFKNLKKFIL